MTDMNKRERDRLLRAYGDMKTAAEMVVEALEAEDDMAFAAAATTCALIWQQASQETLQILKAAVEVEIPDAP